jgi:hypothetical protein
MSKCCSGSTGSMMCLLPIAERHLHLAETSHDKLDAIRIPSGVNLDVESHGNLTVPSIFSPGNLDSMQIDVS